MKAFRVLLIFMLVIGICSSMAFARAPKYNIIGGPHDLRSNTTNWRGAPLGNRPGGGNWNFGGDAIGMTGANAAPTYALCNFCHIAHKFSDVSPTGTGTGQGAGQTPMKLLWNHTPSSQTYTVYSNPDSYYVGSSDITAVVATDQGNSALCLGCHDGTVAVNSNYSPVQPLGNFPVNNAGMVIAADQLGKTHPINFTYNAALATASSGRLRSPATLLSVDAGGEIPLAGGKMQCTTCHDAHQGSGILTQDFKTASGNAPEVSGTTGTFCLYCHL
jgi:hypothetical protein